MKKKLFVFALIAVVSISVAADNAAARGRHKSTSVPYVAMSSRPDADVRAVQEKLLLMGYDSGPADGIPGPQTFRAIMKLQTDKGLEADGIAGAETLRALGL